MAVVAATRTNPAPPEPEQPEEIDRPRIVSLSARAAKVLDNFLAQHGR
jgi:hypothetical protein